MTEHRIVCSGKGRPHHLHIYIRDKDGVTWHREYLEKQSWTKECRPFVIETREVGPWEKVET